MKFRFILGVVVVLALAAVGCTSSSGGDDSTTTTQAVVTTTAAPSTTTTQAPTTTAAPTTTTTEPPAEVPATNEPVMVYGGVVNSSVAQTESTEADGVTVLTLEYVDTIEMSDPRASGTAEWAALLYSPDTAVGGTWVAEEDTLVNDGGEWVGYRTGTYILARNMPTALTTGSGVVTGEAHYIGTGAYEGLRMDLYTSSDGIIGTIRPLEDDTQADDAASSVEYVPATFDTVTVHGSWTESTPTEAGSESVDGVEIVTLDYSDVLEMSDPRASGTMEYTTTLTVPDTSVGGTWIVEEVALVNDDGTWVGDAMGAYIYTDNMPSALTTEDTVIIGEWHLIGTGEYEGLRLDFYNSSDGVVGTIRPIE